MSEPASDSEEDEYSHQTASTLNLAISSPFSRRIGAPAQGRMQILYTTHTNPQQGLYDVSYDGPYTRRNTFKVHFHEPQCPMVHDRHSTPRAILPDHPTPPLWVYQFHLHQIMVYKCHCTFCLTNTAAWRSCPGRTRHLWVFVWPPFPLIGDPTRVDTRTGMAWILAWICDYSQPNWTTEVPPNIGDTALIPTRYSTTSEFGDYLNFFHYASARDPFFPGRRVYYLPLHVRGLPQS